MENSFENQTMPSPTFIDRSEELVPPHFLILEDNDADAELVYYALRKAGIDFVPMRVMTEESFLEEVINRPPDIILSDYSLPQFTGLQALRLVKEYNCEAPFILVTGSQTEDVAVACMKEGAADYILKSNLTRLPSAVQNALKRSQSEKEKAEAIKALRKSEEQLLQSQKLEAVGRLAGGIAHDFNNLLTVIRGYSELTLKRLGEEDPLRRGIEEINSASGRAASLTHQLLAFSRKQVMQPRVLDLNSIVANIEKMLRRMIGENIEMRTVIQPDLGNVKADPGQLEQVIMNLVVNARDAMPYGGKITIETSNVYLDDSYAKQYVSVGSGAHVMLAISDTGIGMDEETKQHIFEPFFTTKELGKGTGLGLSTVYGIIKQSEGSIWVYSEAGRGTTFKIYLPRVSASAEDYRLPSALNKVATGTETILLVEDADIVRKLATEVLESSGYRVLQAKSGEDALLLCEQEETRIHLLLTDVVMAKMSGKELADRLAPLRPEMKVLFMSGYTDDSIVHHGVLDPRVSFIEKPFTPGGLTQKIREVLDG